MFCSPVAGGVGCREILQFPGGGFCYRIMNVAMHLYFTNVMAFISLLYEPLLFNEFENIWLPLNMKL